MKVTYIFRPKGKAFSIEKVFHTIIEEIKNNSSFNVKNETIKTYGFWPITIMLNIILYALKSRRKGIFHITGDVQYLGCLMNSKNTILTIHDLVPLHNKNVPWYSRKLCYWLWYYIPLKRLKYITCISEATKCDLISFFPWAEKKISVIPNPVDPAFLYYPKVFNASRPVILHIGTKPNKNLTRVAAALKGITCHLQIVGKISKEQETALIENHIDYSCVSNLTDEEIIQEYKNCDILSFPSLFEGFGMPIIEGQSIGRPVLSSNIEPMKSVAGEGALLVSPKEITEIRNGVISIIQDENLRNKLIKCGLDNCENYKASKIASLYTHLYISLKGNK